MMDTKKNDNKKHAKTSNRRIRLAEGETIRCPLTGELIPACCCPAKK